MKSYISLKVFTVLPQFPIKENSTISEPWKGLERGVVALMLYSLKLSTTSNQLLY